MNVYRKPPRKQQAQADTLPDELPADMQFPDELPADFQFGGEQAQPVQPSAPAPTSWVEALFPRSSASADRPAYSPQALASAAQDVASLPGRALAASVRPEGETFTESMARLQGSPRAAERGMLPGQEASETILRDPVTLALAALPTWIPARLLAATGRGAALGRGLLAGTQAGGLVAGSRQAERVAGGQDIAPGEIGIDIGSGAAIAGGLGIAGPLLKKAGGKWLTTVIKPTDKARSAGWNPEGLMQEIGNESRFRRVPFTLGGMRTAAQEAIDARAAYRPMAISADEAEALAEGVFPRVNLRRAYGAGAQEIDQAISDQSLTGAVKFAPTAKTWLKEELQVLPAESAPRMLTDYAPIESALNARRGIDKFAFDPNEKGLSLARGIGAKGSRREINRQLDEFAPRTRMIDKSLAPLLANAEGIGIVGERRLNNALFNPVDIATGMMAGGATNSVENGIKTALALRLLRSPAPASAMYMAGRASEGLSNRLGLGSRLGLGLRGATTDNAR